jgi:sugar lactone lactonase YvrE
VGYGDSAQNGTTGDSNPMAGLYRVNPDSGEKSTVATGLGMANGVALGPDGAIYATNDFGSDVDRVKDGKVEHPWASVFSSNGVVVSPDNSYVYVAQTFAPAAIQRISVAKPSEVTVHAAAGEADASGGLDSMTQDARGNLYVAANGGGQVWRVAPNGAICVLARGLMNPSAVAFGTGPYARNLYATTFGGQIVQLADVRATPPAAGAPAATAGKGILAGRVRGAGRARRVVVTLRRGGRAVARHRGRRYRFRVKPRHYRLHAAARGLRCRDRIVLVRAGHTKRAQVRCRNG